MFSYMYLIEEAVSARVPNHPLCVAMLHRSKAAERVFVEFKKQDNEEFTPIFKKGGCHDWEHGGYADKVTECMSSRPKGYIYNICE